MTSPALNESLGWAATAVFVASYFFARPGALRAMQMLGALLWVLYGLLIDSAPVIVANVLVLAAAAWTNVRGPSREPQKPRENADSAEASDPRGAIRSPSPPENPRPR